MSPSTQKWTLMARCLHGEASAEEQSELARHLQQDETWQRQYELLSHIWHQQQDLPADTTIPESEKISRILYKAQLAQYDQQLTRRRIYMRRWWAAASVVLLLGLAAWLWKGGNTDNWEQPAVPETLVAKNGSRIRSLLADGTVVWLNAGSSLEYINDFSGTTREVRLTGEAYFDVVKMPERPFIVHASDIDIRVLGTVFTVKSYPDDNSVETTLYHGLVKVLRSGDPEEKAVELKPNQKFIMRREAATSEEKWSDSEATAAPRPPMPYQVASIDSTKKDNERIEMAWLYSRLEFRGDNFEQLARKLERWYNVRIIFTDEKVKNLSVDGSFEKETVAQAFAALKTVFTNLNYKIVNNEIYVGLSG